MRVVCAWCQKEGRSRPLRVTEPIDDTSETHGICHRHQEAIFEAFPSKSFPSTRWLFIAAAGDVQAYNHLVTVLRAIPDATVIMDRRHGERRRGKRSVTPESRRGERRVRHPEPNSLGYLLVRFTPRDTDTRLTP